MARVPAEGRFYREELALNHFRTLSEAESEILAQAKDDVDKGLPPSIVGAVILREWLVAVAARRNELELQSQKGFISDEKLAELHSCRCDLAKYGGFGN